MPFKKYMGKVVAAGMLLATAGQAESLSLDAYLSQVRGQNEGVKSQEMIAEGAKLRGQEGNMETAFTLVSEASYLEDARPPASIGGTRTTVKNFSLGISKVFDFGLQAKIYEQITATDIRGLPAQAQAFGILTNYVDASPWLELRQPLWKNGFGRDVQARREQTNANAAKTQYDNSFRMKSTLAAAESAYWQLALAQELYDIQKDSLERDRKLRDWAQRRTRNDLADRADFLQTDAVFRVQELNVTAAANELRAAARNFNSVRGIDSDEVKEKLQPIDNVALDKLTPPQRAKFRDDVKSAAANEKMQRAMATLGRERNAPQLDVYARYSFLGRDNTGNLGPAISSAYNFNYPYTLVGVQFSMPLDFGLIADDRAGYQKEQRGAELEYSRKVFEQESDWKDLTRRLEESKQRLQLARQIEDIQREKVDHEKTRLNRAQTTTFQVLQFETDYNNSRVAHLRAANDVLGIIAKMKVFGGSDDAR